MSTVEAADGVEALLAQVAWAGRLASGLLGDRADADDVSGCSPRRRAAASLAPTPESATYPSRIRDRIRPRASGGMIRAWRQTGRNTCQRRSGHCDAAAMWTGGEIDVVILASRAGGVTCGSLEHPHPASPRRAAATSSMSKECLPSPVLTNESCAPPLQDIFRPEDPRTSRTKSRSRSPRTR
jgi:hypothetical protein